MDNKSLPPKSEKLLPPYREEKAPLPPKSPSLSPSTPPTPPPPPTTSPPSPPPVSPPPVTSSIASVGLSPNPSKKTPFNKKTWLIILLAFFILAGIVGGIYLVQQRQQLKGKATVSGRLICMPLDDQGNITNEKYRYHRIKVKNETNQNIQIKVQENLCPYEPGQPVSGYRCDNYSQAYPLIVDAGQEKIIAIDIPCEKIGQLDVSKDKDHYEYVGIDPNTIPDCFNTIDNQVWQGGIAFTIKANTCANCIIQGYKVMMPGNKKDISPVFDQEVTCVDTNGVAHSSYVNPYQFLNIPAGQYTCSAEVPDGYTVGSTLCINNYNCHETTPVMGASKIFDCPAGGEADLWWHYYTPTPTLTPTTEPPTSTPTLTPILTPTSKPPTSTPIPTNTPAPSYSCECSDIKLYNQNWDEIQPTNIIAGQTIYIAVFGQEDFPTYTIDRGRIRINKTTWDADDETQMTVTNHPNEFYITYHIPTSGGSFKIEGEVHLTGPEEEGHWQ
ncbi:hypothetical protein COT63_01240 [Candidatus Shapirobacteria bacterium CG09_land_8_20_14_0_10_38_17]|uniref:Uncharacterized protein n=1 Tax=Candidatus Shapirobacteria bacterium CG09_land_8_20_14_0_10_38_17 TaxID=1974884 RepID=A0A2H0WTE0_9BACT|nr:MAG: hypothetical protein COT63_01240 [Candidatus Shapirobacteria bacterium CG09_land_8_20_14_0_10_38_17]